MFNSLSLADYDFTGYPSIQIIATLFTVFKVLSALAVITPLAAMILPATRLWAKVYQKQLAFAVAIFSVITLFLYIMVNMLYARIP